MHDCRFIPIFAGTKNLGMLNVHEKILVSQIKAGDEKVYKYIYDHHYPVLCKVAFRYVQDVFVAENIVQEVIINLWNKRESIDIKVSLRSYLLVAVRNNCLTHLSSSTSQREVSFSNLSDMDMNTMEYILMDPSSKIDEVELYQMVEKVVGGLSEECRRVFVLSRVEHKSYEEIAHQLGISVNTVKYHMKNALATMRHELSAFMLFFIWAYLDI